MNASRPRQLIALNSAADEVEFVPRNAFQFVAESVSQPRKNGSEPMDDQLGRLLRADTHAAFASVNLYSYLFRGQPSVSN